MSNDGLQPRLDVVRSVFHPVALKQKRSNETMLKLRPAKHIRLSLFAFTRSEDLAGFTAQDGFTHFKTHTAPKCKKATSCLRTSHHSEVSPHKTVSPTAPCVGRESSAFIAVGSLSQLDTPRSHSTG